MDKTDMCTVADAGNGIGLLFGIEAGWSFWEKHNKQAKKVLRQRRYFRPIRNFTYLDKVIRNNHDEVVTTSRPHNHGYAIDRQKLNLITALHKDPYTAVVYFARVVDKTKAIHAI